jgi:hypothetical protein
VIDSKLLCSRAVIDIKNHKPLLTHIVCTENLILVDYVTESPNTQAAHLPLQHDQLMSECRVLCLKSALRLERRGEQGQEETEQRDHRRSRYRKLDSARREAETR